MSRLVLRSARRRPTGSALIIVLWSLVLLSMGAVSVLYGTRVDLRVAKNIGDRTQARFLALAAIEKAKAVLYRESESRKQTGESFSRVPYDSATDFREQKLGNGTYQVIRAPRDGEVGTLVYGVLDMERLLDVATVTAAELMKLPDFTPDAAAAIIDWRDRDQKLSPQGAESAYYARLDRPYLMRNGPPETLLELLAVKGVTPERLLGEDLNANGLLDPAENDGDRTPPDDDADGQLYAGWSRYLAFSNTTQNLNARGEPRVHIQNGSEEELATVEGLSEDLANAITKYRQVQQLQSLADLLGVKRTEENPNAGRNRRRPNRGRSRNNRGNNNTNANNTNGNNSNLRVVGGEIIDQAQLIEFADGLTSREADLTNVVNVNTADQVVLGCLPGISEDLAREIVDQRQRIGSFRNLAQLLEVDGIDRAKLKEILPRLCVRSGTFRIIGEGAIESSGARYRIEAVIRRTDTDFKLLAYREDV